MKTKKKRPIIKVESYYLQYFKEKLEEKKNYIPLSFNFVKQRYTNNTKSDLQVTHNSFLDKRIVNYLHKKKYKIEFTFMINNKKINVRLFFFHEISDNMINKLLKKIYLLLLFLDEKSANININIYFTHFKKMMPHDNNYTSYNINSGLCSFHPNINEITIYREEEWFKVLIHELLHAFNYDNKYEKINHSKIVKIFNIKQLDLFSETYVEVWATVINVIITGFLSNKPFIKWCNIALNKEFIHCINQNKKILASFNTKYELEIQKPQFIHLEKQNILYYYLFKMILFYHLGKFIRICNNDDHILQLNKKKTLLLLNLIMDTYKKPHFVQLIKNKRLKQTKNLKMTITK